MDESAMKGLKLNDSDADIPKSRIYSSVIRIVVEGYDTLVPAYDVDLALRKHFASCGEVIHVNIPGYAPNLTPVLSRFALVYIRGKHAEKKALKLSGSDVGGHKVIAKAYPPHIQAKKVDPEFASILAASRDQDNERQIMMGVTGFDIRLDMDVVANTLRKHFSQCGPVHPVCVFPEIDTRKSHLLCSEAFVTLNGEDALEKVLLQLGGCHVDGFKNIHVCYVPGPPKRERNESVGYHPKFSRMKRRKESGVECSRKKYGVRTTD